MEPAQSASLAPHPSAAAVTGLGPLSHEMQRASAQYALSALRPLVFGVTRLDYGVMNLSDARKPSAASTWLRSKSDLAVCIAGNTAASQSQRSPDGSQNRTVTTFTDHAYYDAGCSTLWRTDTGSIATTVDMRDSEVAYSSIVGTETVRMPDGRVAEVDQVSAGSDAPGAASPSYSLSVTANTSQSGASDAFFVDCDEAQCRFGDISGLATTDALPAVGAYVVDRPDGPSARTFTGIFAIGVAGSRASTAFGGDGITGQTLTRNLEEKRTSARDAAGNVTVMIGLRDAANDVASSAAFSENAISGTVEQASDAFAVARFGADVNGYGTIVYADGTRGAIAGFGIQN